jgi:ubiquinone/menaquinone biosynthesis C-methylase UbiE
MMSEPTFKTLEQEGWSDRASTYDAYTARISSSGIDPLLDAAGIGAKQNVLDICCGTGLVTAAAIERGATLTGIDISAEMVAMAQSKGLKADFRTGDAEALAFPDAAFNRVICNFGHFHLQEPNRAIAEAARVLERAGRYAYTTWCGPDVSPFFKIISEAVQAHGRMDVGLPPAPSPFRLSDRSESMKAMQDAGFTNIRFGDFQAHLDWPKADIIHFIERGTVRVSMIIRAQQPDARKKIEQAIESELSKYATDGTLRLTIPALVVSGTKS